MIDWLLNNWEFVAGGLIVLLAIIIIKIYL
jgi:hypothetical protein